MSNIKWKFTDEEIIFISPADKFDDHVRKFSQKFGQDQNKITIIENGNTNTRNLIESSPATDPWSADVPKDSIVSEDESQTVQLSDVPDLLDESNPASDNLALTDSDSSDSESSSGDLG
jgi:hypothetical protein